MANALAPLPTETSALREMTLADAPGYFTAIAAGIAHGLTPPNALKSSFGKWMSENAEAVQTFGLANFYDGPDASRAMVNETRLLQFLAIMVAEQQRQIAHLTSEAARVRAVLPYLPAEA